jgi:DNA repair protein RadC
MRINKYTVMYQNPGRNLALVRESAHNYDVCFSCPQDVRDAMCQIFHADNLPEEHVWLITTDTRNKCRGIMEISKGSCNASMFPVREILRDVLMMDGISFFIVHNHPSGEVSPSREDKTATEKLRSAAKLMDLNLNDHIIIGVEGTYYSFHENDWR